MLLKSLKGSRVKGTAWREMQSVDKANSVLAVSAECKEMGRYRRPLMGRSRVARSGNGIQRGDVMRKDRREAKRVGVGTWTDIWSDKTANRSHEERHLVCLVSEMALPASSRLPPPPTIHQQNLTFYLKCSKLMSTKRCHS